jgi:hypothetical protein
MKFKHLSDYSLAECQNEIKWTRRWQMMMYIIAAICLIGSFFLNRTEFLALSALAFGVTTMLHMDEHNYLDRIAKLKEESE